MPFLADRQRAQALDIDGDIGQLGHLFIVSMVYAGCEMRALCVLAVCAGCNSVFGLGETEFAIPDADPCPDDTDCDGVVDAVDKCPALPDPGQLDFDRDGIGDACDACSMEFVGDSDDDADGVEAAADVCPGLADAMQGDADGDGIGDACDPAGTRDTLQCWADFAAATNADEGWPIEDPWMLSGSLVIHVPEDTEPFTIAPRFAVALPSTGVAIQTGLSLSVSDPDFAAGIALGASDAPSLECLLGRTGGGTREVRLVATGATVASMPITIDTPVLMTLTLDANGIASCTARVPNGSSVVATATASTVTTTGIVLIARSSHATFDQLAIYALAPP